MTSISSIKTLILELPPSCISFCPSAPDYFVVGTYYLHPSTSDNAVLEVGDTQETNQASDDAPSNPKRSGSLILFRLENDSVTQIETIACDNAILDIKWTPHSTQLGALLAVALSTQKFLLYELQVHEGNAQLRFHSDYLIGETKDLGMVLSIAWHPMKPQWLGFTMSNGEVYVCESQGEHMWDPQKAPHSFHKVYSHELEAWTFSFVFAEDGLSLLSGGDDAVLRSWSRQSSEHVAEWQDRKLHNAGVTAILPLSDELAVTGSYDDHIRLISCSPGKRRTVEAELNVGGGVWRVQLLEPQEGAKVRNILKSKRVYPVGLVILASCMHVGSSIIRLRHNGREDGTWAFDILAKFEEHQSMNYGCDAQPGEDGSGEDRVVVSTSFYDRRLCLWKVNIPKLMWMKDEEEKKEKT